MKEKPSGILDFMSIVIGILFISFFIFNILGFLNDFKANPFFWTLEGFGLKGNILSIVSLILGIFFIYPIFKLKSKK